jgi:16S rRNA (guanine527-N7)-methyltransferase
MSDLLFNPDVLAPEAMEKLKSFEALLLKWNKKLNIVSANNESLIWNRHILDSLQLIPFLGSANKVADMGSGIGFPSIPLALACPNLDVFAIEVNKKKQALMNEAVKELGIPNFHLLPDSVHSVVISHLDAVCCRAFGEFMRDAQLAYKMLRPGGCFLTYKLEEENRVPEGFEAVANHRYQLPNYPRAFNVVITQKFREFE